MIGRKNVFIWRGYTDGLKVIYQTHTHTHNNHTFARQFGMCSPVDSGISNNKHPMTQLRSNREREHIVMGLDHVSLYLSHGSVCVCVCVMMISVFYQLATIHKETQLSYSCCFV
jgi:hypothetical protein